MGNPKDEVYERYAKRPVDGPLSFQGPCWEIWRWFFTRDFLETRKVYVGSFLDPEAIKI